MYIDIDIQNKQIKVYQLALIICFQSDKGHNIGTAYSNKRKTMGTVHTANFLLQLLTHPHAKETSLA